MKPRIEYAVQAEVSDYESIKAKIDRGISRQSEGRQEVSDGLKQMHSSKSYLKKYKTFAAFVETEYGHSPKWAYQQMRDWQDAAEENENEKGLKLLEAARVTGFHKVNDLPSQQEKETLSTPELGKEQEHQADVIKDASNHPIPKNLLPLWNRRQEVQELMTIASQLKCAIEKIYETHDPLFQGGSFNAQMHVATLVAIHHQLAHCKPGVVCPGCNGEIKDDHGRECRMCRRTGFISELQWTTYQHSNDLDAMAKTASRNGSTRLSV